MTNQKPNTGFEDDEPEIWTSSEQYYDEVGYGYMGFGDGDGVSIKDYYVETTDYRIYWL